MQRLGQHFLTDGDVLQKIAEAINSQSGEVIIEIGAGHGELTEKLGDRLEVIGDRENQKPRIIAIEKDKQLVLELTAKFAENSNIEIVEGDVLKLLPPITYHLSPLTYSIIGNLPYYITGHLLRVISELAVKPARCVFLVQKEVAERICAHPSPTKIDDGLTHIHPTHSKAMCGMNRLAASVQFWAKPEILFTVPKESFEPQPKVESALIELVKRKMENGKWENRETVDQYYKTVRALFQQPRKTILNNLREERREKKEEREIQQTQLIEKIKKLGINPGDRPQALSVEQIQAIASLLS